MSNAHLKSIVESLMADESFKNQLTSSPDEDRFIQQLVAAAREKGHEITPDAVRGFLLQPVGSGELSDSDLESVAGGSLGQFMELWYYNRFTSGKVKC
jgi:predicted ribosomally synthesized peptide with nif11-like leader